MTATRSLVQGRSLDEVDRRMIHALQISPRARWAALAPVVGVDAVTLARRWERLSAEGLAWVAGLPGAAARGPAAILEVEAQPGATPQIADVLAADPESFTVDHTAGGRDLLVLVGAPDLTALGDYVIGRMRELDGVRATRTHLLSSPFTDAGQWRLGALSPEEVAAVGRTVTAPGAARLRVDPQLEDALLTLLARDGRATVATIARTLDVGQRRVRESMAALTARGRLEVRTEIARAHSGWPVHAWYFLRVPAALTERVGAALTRLGEVRLAVSTIGPYNLVLSVWMRTLADVQRLEVAIGKRVPDVSIADRSVVLRSLKKEGRVLDQHGHATGTVVPLLNDFARDDAR
ncbi:Lrp/AsnC family transcriptional regulator [Cellulomonas sp. C5510]|uniref:Lrp/AsnC family transcriptional regulator n=1 Tax=Cellulomonas sp. C5510 TaxID=2871170 RepID=UPI001C96960E|nr:Lrp/AsnC family transcriptional regulator [Cellulomonas sp. C5510]QZN85408.1 Lrp/AsnC family transcriptional regulator [Cellulomonas sp. C5510]